MPTLRYCPPLLRTLDPHARADALGLPRADALLLTAMHLLDEDDPALAWDFLDSFVGDAQGLAADLRAGVETDHRETIVGIAHMLKSTMALLGLADLSERCAWLEHHGADLDRRALRQHVGAITTRLDALALRLARPHAA